METKLLSEINQVLSMFPEYWEEDTLLKTKVIDDLRNYRSDLIEKLLDNETIKHTYAMKINDTYVFKINEFIIMLRYKNYWEDSYTKYSNEIGLTSDGKYLKYNTDVVLDFPHKDGVLEGGMTKEDQGKDEIFYHNVLAKEEIDTMLSPKVLTNMKKYDTDGEREVTEFTDRDNLILKGNNLIALHTLKERFAGKVKLIYIDPPYNTEGDSFDYNDKFNHSTWLTFMKNRLEIAKDLLSEDGVLLINTDEIEQAYLKVLTDEILGRENFVGDIIWKKRRGGGNDSRYLAIDHDYIMVYAKNKSKDVHTEKWRIPYEIEYLKRYSEFDEIANKRYYWDTLSRDGLQNPIIVELDLPDGTKTTINSQKSKDTILKEIDSGQIRITKTKNGWSIQHRVYQPEGRVLRSIIEEDKALNGTAKDEIKDLFGYNAFTNPKPEKLINILINMITEEGDIVLDFFMGSCTTQAVAHKMNRQYIGIEQMNYINEVSIPRLQKVIDGEQGGISEDVKWQGGSSFVYAELYELNQQFVDAIHKVQSDEELSSLIDEVKNKAFLDFKVDIDKLTNNEEKFADLSLEEKKDILIKALDVNQMYLGYSEIDDSQYGISDSVKQFNHSFYHRGEQS